VDGTWAPVIVKNAAGAVVKQAWYFNGYFPWLGMLFCAPIIGLWYWCTDQYIVQRALGAPDQRTARRGSIFAGVLKLLPVYLFIVPGLIAFALAKSGKVPGLEVMMGADGTAIARESQAAFPLLVKYLLPVGLRGLVVAGLLSALMSSLAGAFNASSTLFTIDLYQKWKPKATQHQMVRTGRFVTGVMVFIALLWIPVIQGAHGLYFYLQSVQGYLAPPIFVVFFFGVFWKRLNAKGCLWALITGLALGLFRMLVDTPVALGMFGYADAAQTVAKGYAEGSFLWIINNIYFQYFSVVITIISIAVMVIVSYMTKEPDYERIKSLTFGTRTAEDRRQIRLSWDWRDVLASAFVLVCILAAYIYFTG
jgi:SSS family solute:Na+ symporter